MADLVICLSDRGGGLLDAISNLSGSIIRFFLESAAFQCYHKVVEKLITEGLFSERPRGNQLFRIIEFETGARRHRRGDNLSFLARQLTS